MKAETITIKHRNGLSSEILIEQNGKTMCMPNTLASWKNLKTVNDFDTFEVVVEEQHGFWTPGYGHDDEVDIRIVPFKESCPYLARFVSDGAARARADEIMKDVRSATIKAGFQA